MAVQQCFPLQSEIQEKSDMKRSRIEPLDNLTPSGLAIGLEGFAKLRFDALKLCL